MYFNKAQIYIDIAAIQCKKNHPLVLFWYCFGTILVLFCREYGTATFYLGLMGGTFIVLRATSYRIPVP
jgi:hypothetical protein